MNALFLCFNSDYIDYAKGAISSWQRYYPDWIVHCHAVNCKYQITNDPWWQRKNIVIDLHQESFGDKGLEREYCNSKRFCAFYKWINLYDKIIATDVDILFKERLTEIEDALEKYDICMHYKDINDVRNKAGASFLAFRSGNGAKNFLSTYKKYLNSSGRNWWNDQICLAKAYEELKSIISVYILEYEDYCYSGLDIEGLKRCHVIQPRGDKNSPVLQMYRNMVESEIGGTYGRIMIIGSGLSAEKAKKWDLSGWHVIAINNAWKITPLWNELIYPNDFPTKDLPTELGKNKSLVPYNIYMPANTAFGTQEKRGNTMIFQALYYALLKRPMIIGTIGADVYYPAKGPTHFYGKGGLDPLRFGEDYLKDKFVRFLDCAKSNNVEVYNYSGETRGLNPFKQRIFQVEFIARRWPKHRIQPHQVSLSGRKPRQNIR